MIELSEAPVFTALDRVAVTFACELVTDAADREPLCGFRLAQIYRELFGPIAHRKTVAPSGLAMARARRLFTGSRSFLDYITTGQPGVNGRPLFFAAALDADGESARDAMVLRPPEWSYEFESTRVTLSTAPTARAIPVLFVDHFCVFESGRIFYLASFGQTPEATPRLDEYGLIQLERLTLDPESAADASYLGFAWMAPDRRQASLPATSLKGFLDARLAMLNSDAETPNAIHDVLRPFGILPQGKTFQMAPHGWLKNALVQVEDLALLQTAAFACRCFESEYRGDNSPASTPAVPEALAQVHADWRSATAGVPRPHVAEQIDGSAESPIARPLLAFAGLAQGIPDFPRQDRSEVHDSTRPATAAPESMFYVHPAFELAVGVSWRTFSDAQREVGGCPYAMMAWIIGLHDEVIVTDMEERIERMIYGESAPGAIAEQLGRAEPAADLMRVWRKAASFWRPRSAMIDANLKARLDIFRWCSIHRSGNVFRYPTERDLLIAISQSRGTDARFNDAHGTLDRYESLVEDLSGLTANYAAVRANWLLGVITVLGLIALPQAISDTANLLGLPIDPLWTALALLGSAIALFLLWNRTPKIR